MPKQPINYAIDDAKSVDDNLAAFALKLTELDPSLASVLSPVLQSLSNGDTVDHDHLRTALFSATAPEEVIDTNENGGSQ